MEYGFTSTSLRPYRIEEVVQAAASCGAKVIEWGSDHHVLNSGDAEKAKALCDGHGIKVSAYGSYYRIGTGSYGEWESLCENAAILGAKCIRTWLGKKGSRATSEKEYSDMVEESLKMSDAAKEYGLIISNECHPNTYNDTTESSLRYLRDTGRENVRTYYQSWYRDRNGDMEKLDRLFPYVTDVHVSFSELKKFQTFRRKDPEFIRDILKEFARRDFVGNVLIEFTKGGKSDNLVQDVKKLKFLISEIEGLNV